MSSTSIEQYKDDAIRFSAEHAASRERKSIRVAATLLTNRIAVAVLNQLGMPGEIESSYRYINVHNPRCPLRFEPESKSWSCAPALENHPAWGINWAGAVLICRTLGGRLPWEHEWVSFASNNDPTRTYPWGNDPPTKSLANFGEHFGGTSPVGSFPASEIGLYDLAGNLSEWCQDGHELAGGHKALFERVAKGGAWSKDEHYLEIATRRGKWERLGTTTIGLRPVWDD
jgi:formylglycine-generating enzyme required for sulfatase activity